MAIEYSANSTDVDSRIDPFSTRKSLLLRLKQDGPAKELAWSEFGRRYERVIQACGRKLGASAAEQKDLVQDVLIGFWRSLSSFRYDPRRGRFRGYLAVCTRRAFLKMRRHCRHGSPAESASCVRDFDIAACDDVGFVDECDTLGRAKEIVRRRYDATPEQRRTYQAFERFALFERDVVAVAEELDMSVDSVRKAKARVSAAITEVARDLEKS